MLAILSSAKTKILIEIRVDIVHNNDVLGPDIISETGQPHPCVEK